MIGTILAVRLAHLDSLNYSNNPVEKNLANMIIFWLDKCSKESTREVLLKAVEVQIVNSHQTAQKICGLLRMFDRYV